MTFPTDPKEQKPEAPAIITNSKDFGKTGYFLRPNHPDFMDASELKAIGWSGIRSNSISRDVEIWHSGEVQAVITAGDMMLNPRAVEAAYERVFDLKPGTADFSNPRTLR